MRDKNKTTRHDILESACRIFAEKGYHRATIDGICKDAGANIALVNYYFRDKASLYDAVWQKSFNRASGTFPLDAAVDDSTSPQDSLRIAVHSILMRIFDDGDAGIFSRLMVQEMACPTLRLSEIADKAIRPQFEYLCRIIRDILGDDAAGRDLITICATGIMGQCIIFASNRPLRRHLLGSSDFNAGHVERLAAHIAKFSLAGLDAVKECEKEVGE